MPTYAGGEPGRISSEYPRADVDFAATAEYVLKTSSRVPGGTSYVILLTSAQPGLERLAIRCTLGSSHEKYARRMFKENEAQVDVRNAPFDGFFRLPLPENKRVIVWFKPQDYRREQFSCASLYSRTTRTMTHIPYLSPCKLRSNIK